MKSVSRSLPQGNREPYQPGHDEQRDKQKRPLLVGLRQHRIYCKGLERAGAPEATLARQKPLGGRLTIVRSIVPNLVGKVTAEETAYFFRTRVFAVEESTRSEVVGLLADLELPVGGEGLLRVVL